MINVSSCSSDLSGMVSRSAIQTPPQALGPTLETDMSEYEVRRSRRLCLPVGVNKSPGSIGIPSRFSILPTERMLIERILTSRNLFWSLALVWLNALSDGGAKRTAQIAKASKNRRQDALDI